MSLCLRGSAEWDRGWKNFRVWIEYELGNEDIEEKQQRYQTLSVYAVQYISLDNSKVGKSFSNVLVLSFMRVKSVFCNMRTTVSCNNFSNNNSGLSSSRCFYAAIWGSEERYSLHRREKLREYKFHYPGKNQSEKIIISVHQGVFKAFSCLFF